MSDIDRPYRPATNLREPESDYVQERLDGCAWEDLEEIEILLKIERWALQGASGVYDGMHSDKIRNEHPEAWEAIHKELNPTRLEKIRHRDEKRELRIEAREKARERQLERAKELWVELGGETP